MLQTALLGFALATTGLVDTSAVPAVRPDSVTVPAGPLARGIGVTLGQFADSQPKRRRAVEVSDAYEVRLRIHRYGSYAIYPLFALQAIAGTRIYPDPRNAPDWAKTSHRAGATGLALAFTSNTITGLWNLYDSRSTESGRTKRILHTLLMLGSDAGFTYAGARLSDQAENSVEKRRLHRTIAYSSMAATLAGVAVIKFWPED